MNYIGNAQFWYKHQQILFIFCINQNWKNIITQILGRLPVGGKGGGRRRRSITKPKWRKDTATLVCFRSMTLSMESPGSSDRHSNNWLSQESARCSLGNKALAPEGCNSTSRFFSSFLVTLASSIWWVKPVHHSQWTEHSQYNTASEQNTVYTTQPVNRT